MNLDTTASLLTRISYIDNRQVTEEAIASWQSLLGDAPYDLCIQAMEAHFRDKPGVYIMPGHVLEGARALHKERQRDAGRTAREASDRSEKIRQAALERKAADMGTRVATPEDAERYGKGALDAVMAAVLAAPRTSPGGPVIKGAGVKAGLAALERYREKHGRAPLVDHRRQRCENPLCACTHDEPCEAGWVPVDPGDPAAAVTPCPNCKGRANAIVNNANGDRRAAAQLLREQIKVDAAGPAAGSRDNAW